MCLKWRYLYLKSLEFGIGTVAKQHIQAVRKGNGPQRPVGWSQSVPWAAMGLRANFGGGGGGGVGFRGTGTSIKMDFALAKVNKSSTIDDNRVTNGKLGNHSKFKKSWISTANTSNQISSPLGSNWRSEGAALLKGLQEGIPQSSATPLEAVAVSIPERKETEWSVVVKMLAPESGRTIPTTSNYCGPASQSSKRSQTIWNIYISKSFKLK